jgi:KDO2-lipid IV(A) lauroyltransferase
MAHARSVVADYAVYLAVRALICVVQAIPPALGRALAIKLAALGYRLDRRHREVARDNLRHAFPGRWGEAELDRMVQATFRHFCIMLLEIVLLPRKLHAGNLNRYLRLVEPEQRDNLQRLVHTGRPVLFVSAHLGNWEIGSYCFGLVGYASYAIARPLDNPFLDRFLRRFRQNTGQQLLEKTGSLEQINEILRKGGRLALLADQDAGPRGLFVNFLGRPASTHKAVALLALHHQAPLVVLGTRKFGEPMRYEIIVQDVILPERYQNLPDAVRAISERFSAALERMIEAAPDQYFWLHRRWKSQPAKPRRLAA